MLSSKPSTGEFQERDQGSWFTYRPTVNAWALQHGLPFEVDVLDGVRFANIKKTVASIAIDEAPDGSPVLERWSLKKNVVYAN